MNSAGEFSIRVLHAHHEHSQVKPGAHAVDCPGSHIPSEPDGEQEKPYESGFHKSAQNKSRSRNGLPLGRVVRLMSSFMLNPFIL